MNETLPKFTESDIIMMYTDYNWKINRDCSLCGKIGDRIFPFADLSEGDMVFVKRNRVLK